MTTDPTMYSKQTRQYLINEANSGQRGQARWWTRCGVSRTPWIRT